MTRLGLRPYHAGDDPPPGSVPVSVVVLTLNEEPNIRRCLASVAWADQVMVVDSGSADRTVPLARAAGAEVMEQPWLGFSAQRDYALRLALLQHDWVYFVDADEWVSPQLATEIAMRLADPRVRGVHAPAAPCVHGHLDPPLRLVPRLLGRPACRPALHQVRREPGGRASLRGRAGPAAGQRHRGRGPQGPGRLAAQARTLRATEVRTRRAASAACRNGCARCGTAAIPGRSPAASSRSWSSRLSRPSPSRCFSTCTSQDSASSTAWRGSASASTTRGAR